MPETIFVSFSDIADLANLFCPFSAEIPACWLAAVDDCSVQLYTDSFTPRSDTTVSAIGFTEAFVEAFWTARYSACGCGQIMRYSKRM